MPATTEQLVANLLDREAIRDLPPRYCDCVWRGDLEGLVALFAEDGAFVIITAEGETRVQGRDALLEFYRVGLRHQQRPLIHNQVVELGKKGRASGRCYVDLRSARHNMELMGAGYYHDDYRKVRGKWLFETRRFHAVRVDEGPGSVKKPAAGPVALRRGRRAH